MNKPKSFLGGPIASARPTGSPLPSLTSYVIQTDFINTWKVVRITDGIAYDHARSINTEDQAREIADALNRSAASNFISDTIKGLTTTL